jgi:hypothetical protein
MKNNVGILDRNIRFGLAVVAIIVAIIVGPLTGWAFGLYALATMLIVTGFVGFCGLYTLFGISTCPRQKNQPK